MVQIGVVIVTYNRLLKLKKTLQAYENQEYKPDFIIVVNNCSNDGTKDFLEEWKLENEESRYVINSEKNVGGSGGFYMGEELAMKLDASWIMISDDDAYPCREYLKKIHEFIKENGEKTSVICGKVIENENYVNNHRSFLNPKVFAIRFHLPANLDEYKKEIFYPDFVSYVGTVFNCKILKRAGLVDKDFFIWCDDTEHTFRMKQYGKLVCLTNIWMYHDVEVENQGLSWKTYYGYRNSLLFLKKHFTLRYWLVSLFFLVKTLLCPLRGHSFVAMKVRLVSLRDAFFNRKGRHYIYKPGWKP